MLEKAVNVSEAELESSLSGEKNEEINMLKKQISAVENKISFLKNKNDAQSSIIAPFNGRLERSFSKDTILFFRILTWALHFPVSIHEADYIDEGDEVKFVSTNSQDL